MDGRRRKTVHADAAAGGTSEGRQPLVDVHGVHVRDAHVAIVRRPHVRAIGHANRAYEVFRRYSRRHCSIPTFAAIRFRNHCRLRHSSRNFPLKDSSVAFCHGFPGSMSAVSMPASPSQRKMAAATNSGPWSDRKEHGAPWRLTSRARTSITRPERMPAGHVDRQAFAGPLVDNRQTLERLPVGAGIEHEVVRPHVVLCGRRQRPGPSRGHAASGAPPRDLQPRLAPEPIHPIGAHHVSLPSQENANPGASAINCCYHALISF